jgi:hypothetical protein
VADADPAALYAFRLDGGGALPDPRSPRQPAGPDGPSQCYDQAAFEWTDTGWHGMPLPGSVNYELHVGTFTTDGTFDAAIRHMEHLIELGTTTIELMPVAAFPGRWGWGYDGSGCGQSMNPTADPMGSSVSLMPATLAGSRLCSTSYTTIWARQSARRVRALLHRGSCHTLGPGCQSGPARRRRGPRVHRRERADVAA